MPNPTTPAPCEQPSFDIASGQRVLQDIVDVLMQGMCVIHVRRLQRRELVDARPSVHLAVTAMLSHERSASTLLSVIKAAVTKVREETSALAAPAWI